MHACVYVSYVRVCMYVYVCIYVCMCVYVCLCACMYILCVCMYICNELGGNMARSTQFPIMITRSNIIYEIVSPGAAGSSIYI